VGVLTTVVPLAPAVAEPDDPLVPRYPGRRGPCAGARGGQRARKDRQFRRCVGEGEAARRACADPRQREHRLLRRICVVHQAEDGIRHISRFADRLPCGAVPHHKDRFIRDLHRHKGHTVRGAVSGALKKKMGMHITSTKVEVRGAVYRIHHEM
jgi:hypothetical protein